MQITQAQLQMLTELVEDTIEYYCDQNMTSGQLAWSVVECLAVAKQAELQGEFAAV